MATLRCGGGCTTGPPWHRCGNRARNHNTNSHCGGSAAVGKHWAACRCLRRDQKSRRLRAAAGGGRVSGVAPRYEVTLIELPARTVLFEVLLSLEDWGSALRLASIFGLKAQLRHLVRSPFHFLSATQHDFPPLVFYFVSLFLSRHPSLPAHLIPVTLLACSLQRL